MAAPVTPSLDDKFTREAGPVVLSGVQALLRVLLDQQRADRRAGRRTAGFVSGYRGSPLGTLDFLLARHRKLLDRHDITFVPGVNEELGATAVFGSQLANLYPHPKFDGVFGMWYGKGPGVDRSGDAFKHANLAGVGAVGGVLAVAGDDPASKSSTLPSASEVALYDAQMPVLFPADAQDVLDLGLLGYALSRYSGLWVGFKLVTNVADEYSSAMVGPDRIVPVLPEFEYAGKPWRPGQNPALYAPINLQTERELIEGRLEAARRFARANHLNRTTVRSPRDWLGIVAAGKTYLDVREALRQLGLSDADLERYGIRLFRVGMLYPLEPETLRDFAQGLDEVLVIEEKRPFLELFVRDGLYDLPVRPRVVGKQGERGELLVPGYGELEAEAIARVILRRLSQRLPPEALARASQPVPAPPAALGMAAMRLSSFCSGCPHNRSTVVPEGSLAGGGIGCHGMVLMMDRSTQGFTQMGGEGAQWVGAAPFTETPHLFQNIGDGTLFHSGSLAIRQAIAARTRITFKILYNAAVAMTGGQPVDGGLTVPELTRELAAEGVAKILVLTDEMEKYHGVGLAPDVEVWSRDRLDEAQRLLREQPGVTVIIYDQPCAAELRRKRKRGLAPVRPMRVLINERVCEGCGDCGQKSNCLSVQPVETEFGRKTQIHQSSCNTDYSCLDGECPAFVTVVPHGDRTPVAAARPAPIDEPLPTPKRLLNGECNLYLMGIGGTGVVTVNQILATAAVTEGKTVRSLDQTGLSQKGGAVVSHLRIFDHPTDAANKVSLGAADGYIAFDVLTAADTRHLTRADPERTVAVVSSSHVPTGLMVRNPNVLFPDDSLLHARIDAVTRSADNVYLDAEALSEHFFGSHMPANMIVIGAAFQCGLIPLAAESIEGAIALNGTEVTTNVQAFRLGRKLVADPEWLTRLPLERPGAVAVRPHLTPRVRAVVESVGAEGELHRLLEIRVAELADYQNLAYAKAYADFVARVRAREAQVTDRTELSEAVARYLYKLMAYKDEYEVARLYLTPEFRAAVTAEFGSGATLHYRLHPPALRALGLKKKIALGRWFDLGFRMLRGLRGLRGTPFDLFGYDAIRKEERRLIDEYRSLIEDELATLTTESYERAVKLAGLPDQIRGYEHVKRAGIERFRKAVAEIKAPRDIPVGVTM
jgi:indolepyruvate ferredoxin oxidoreductase